MKILFTNFIYFTISLWLKKFVYDICIGFILNYFIVLYILNVIFIYQTLKIIYILIKTIFQRNWRFFVPFDFTKSYYYLLPIFILIISAVIIFNSYLCHIILFFLNLRLNIMVFVALSCSLMCFTFS